MENDPPVSFRQHSLPVLFLFLLGIMGGWTLKGSEAFTFLNFYEKPDTVDAIAIREENADFRFINPLLFCGVSENKEFDEFKTLEQNVSLLLENRFSEKTNGKVSLYYREIDSGRWFGINEDEKYAPASLLKVPIMIAYFKKAEKMPGFLNNRIYFDGSFDYNIYENFKAEKAILVGNSYTLDELIEYMIQYSDNNAMQLLRMNMDQNFLHEVFTDLGLNVPPESGAVVDFMSVKSYAYFFRTLYNSSYLSREMSEKALEVLSHARFQYGISSGIPSTVPVSQKFGERSMDDPVVEDSSVKELHDCGIVYHPVRSYLLCVMTKGEDFDNLSGIIKDISGFMFKALYQESRL